MITFLVDEEMAEAILGSYDGDPLACPRRVKRRLVRQGLAERTGKLYHLTDYGYQISCDLADEIGDEPLSADAMRWIPDYSLN